MERQELVITECILYSNTPNYGIESPPIFGIQSVNTVVAKLDALVTTHALLENKELDTMRWESYESLNCTVRHSSGQGTGFGKSASAVSLNTLMYTVSVPGTRKIGVRHALALNCVLQCNSTETRVRALLVSATMNCKKFDGHFGSSMVESRMSRVDRFVDTFFDASVTLNSVNRLGGMIGKMKATEQDTFVGESDEGSWIRPVALGTYPETCQSSVGLSPYGVLYLVVPNGSHRGNMSATLVKSDVEMTAWSTKKHCTEHAQTALMSTQCTSCTFGPQKEDSVSSEASRYIGGARLQDSKCERSETTLFEWSHETHVTIERTGTMLTCGDERSCYFGSAGKTYRGWALTCGEDGYESFIGETGETPTLRGDNRLCAMHKNTLFTLMDSEGPCSAGDTGHADVEGHSHPVDCCSDTTAIGGENAPVVEAETASKKYLKAADVAATGSLDFDRGYCTYVTAEMNGLAGNKDSTCPVSNHSFLHKTFKLTEPADYTFANENGKAACGKSAEVSSVKGHRVCRRKFNRYMVLRCKYQIGEPIHGK